MGKYTTMTTKNIIIKPKKIPYNLALVVLTAGASLILGFLSFGGMYALFPLLPLAFAAFGLSVAYEGEIYLQNIKGTLKKLFKHNYLENYLAKEFLMEKFPKNTDDPDCPQFFKDYKAQLELLKKFGHKELNAESKLRKKQIEKTLSDMEKWFASQLFANKKKGKTDESDYALGLQKWLELNGQDEWQKTLEGRNFWFQVVKGLSLVSGLFMGLGTTYLIVEAFTVIPFFAAIPFAMWPLIIVPMAVVAGAAYGMLTYNAVTDLINNHTVTKWYNKLSWEFTPRNVFMVTATVFLVVIALALTVFTAGTWWTVASNARPLFEWMKKLPGVIVGALIIAASSLSFIIQNTAESVDLVDEGLDALEKAANSEENIFQSAYKAIAEGFTHLRETENWLQILNPFRIILKLTVTPLRILLFLGHLASIAVTADRMPGVPQIIAALIAFISEGFEDAHYFIGHDHTDEEEEHGHEHHEQDFKKLLKERLDGNADHSPDVDIPTWILQTIAYPIYALAAAWDTAASKLNDESSNNEKTDSIPPRHPQPLNFWQALDKQRGIPKENEVTIPANAKHPSKEWQVEHTVSVIEKYQRKHLSSVQFGQELADDKIRELDVLKIKIRDSKSPEALAATLENAKNSPVYNQHRLFALNEKTNTQEFIEELPQRVLGQ